MNKTIPFLVSITLATASFSVHAGCDFDYQVCDKACTVSNLGDDAGKNGCVTKCAAEKAACMAEEGADAAVEASKEAWEGTKSFFKELSKD